VYPQNRHAWRRKPLAHNPEVANINIINAPRLPQPANPSYPAPMTNPAEKPKPPLTATRVNNQGLIEVVDLHTGAILCIQKEPRDDFLQGKFDNLQKIETPQGTVWIERGIDPARLFYRPQQPYSASWADLLALRMVEHKETLPRACKALDLPYYLVTRWRREHPEFNDTLQQARRDLAEHFQEEALETARTTTSATSGPNKLKVETLKWAAEKADPEQFGQKLKVDAKHEHSVQVVLDTGIRRRNDPGFVEVEDPKDVTPSLAPAAEPLEIIPQSEPIPEIKNE
jgi:hypothetical protein